MNAAFQSGFASALLDVLFSRLADLIAHEVSKILNVDVSLKKLETSMREALLQLNRVHQFKGDDALLNALRTRANDVASFCYDVDDLIDDIDRKVKKQKSASWSRQPVLRTMKPVKNWSIPRKIHDLHKRLVEITEDLEKNLNINHIEEQPLSHTERLNSLSRQPNLVGRDKDISEIVKELTCLDNNDSKGVSIVGMRGLGKTALAYKILYHEEIKDRYPLILLASFKGKSFDFEYMVANLKEVHDNNIRALNGPSQNNYPLDHDRWLLLIDDLSEMPIMEWRYFHKNYLLHKGRKLLVTTLNSEVAKVGQTSVYFLKPLSDKHCQELIAREASHASNGHDIPAHVSSEFAKKSCGLPLVAIYFGCSIARKVKEKDLDFNANFWNWPTFRKEILPILRSTFLSLEPRLLRCLIYLSLFPQGYHYEAKDLILLWIGEGLVQAHGLRFDEIGWNNFNDLLERSILQLLPATGTGLSRYEIHKFMHSFAQATGLERYAHLGECVSSSYRLNANIRHLSVSHNIQPHFWDKMKCLCGLRTFLTLYDGSQFGEIRQIPRDLFKKVSRLRVLSLKDTNVTELPDSIKNLKHIRYLNVSNTSINRLPETLSKIKTLQILKLKNNPKIPQLPKKFHDLTNLVFIDWNKPDIKTLEPNPPSNIGKLISLQTLPLFIVGEKEGYRITELKDMEYLHGSLCISYLEKVKDGEDAKEAMLNNKSFLQKLELEWTTAKNHTSVADVLEGLKPHDNLEELHLVNYGFPSFPQWLNECLPMLHTLHLEGCSNCIVLPALGKHPTLKTLHLEKLSKLRYMDHNFNGRPTSGTIGCFPSLELLVLCELPELQSWTDLAANDMLHLRELKITNCPRLESLPSLCHLTAFVDLLFDGCQAIGSLPELPASLESLRIRNSDVVKNRCQEGGEDWLKVNRVAHVEIDGIKTPTSGPQCIQSPNRVSPKYVLQGFYGMRSLFGQLIPKI